jgi:hypothetical protein
MAKVGSYSINPKLKNVSLEQFTKLVGGAFKRLPEKEREKAIKEAYEKEYGKVKGSNQSAKKDRRSEDSGTSDSKE